VARWVKESRINTVDRSGEQFLRVLNSDPITYLSWWTYEKSEPTRAGERHALQTRPRLQIDPANVKESGVFREPVVTKDMVFYSCPKSQGGLRLEDEDRMPARSADYAQIVACRLDRPPTWGVTYQGGWGGRPVQWRVATFDRFWCMPSQLKVHLKAGRRLYAGGRGVVAAVELPAPGGEPKVSWQASIEGTPTRMLAADGKLFVVTGESALYCFGPRKVESKIHSATSADRAAKADVWSAKSQEMLKRASVGDGYCLALGLGSGRLIEELARQSQLHIIAVDRDSRKIDAVRRRLHEMRLYGSRVHVVQGDLASLRLPSFMASLVVSEEPAKSRLDEDGTLVERLFSCLRPYGGKACLPLDADRHAAFVRQVQQAKLAGAEVAREGGLTILTRAGALPDAADWPHESGDAAHTFASGDRGARPPFGVLWFGGSLDRVVPCLDGAPPRIAAGRMFLRVGGDLHGVDIYTGRHLWKRNPTGMSDFLAADDGVYVVSGKTCLRLDPATGVQAGQVPLPPELMKEKGLAWQQVRVWGDYLIGTAGKYLVCVDRHCGDLRWKRRSERGGFGLAVGANRVFCIDCWLPGPWRQEEAKGEEGTIAAIDVPSGKTLWETAVAIPADAAVRKAQPSFSPFLNPQLAFCEAADVLVFTRNRSTAAAYKAGTGKLLWSRDIPCKEPPSAFTGYHPPIVLPDRMVSHGGEVIDLLTGKPLGKRLWKGINAETRGCGRALGSPCMVTVRDGHISYFDLTTGGRVYFRGIRSGCTNSLVAAGGILNAPNFARHCTCNYPLSVSLAFATMPEAVGWNQAR
jgi:outer membrane protein assembly factor BamB